MKDLPMAITATEGLMDFMHATSSSKGKKNTRKPQKSSGTKESKHLDGNNGKKGKEGDTSKGKDVDSSQK